MSVAEDWQYGTRCKIVATTAHLAGRPYRAHTEYVSVRACDCCKPSPPHYRCACVWVAPIDVADWRCFVITSFDESSRTLRVTDRVGALLLCQFGCVLMQTCARCHSARFYVSCVGACGVQLTSSPLLEFIGSVGSVWAAQMWDIEKGNEKKIIRNRYIANGHRSMRRLRKLDTVSRTTARKNDALWAARLYARVLDKTKKCSCFLLSAPVTSTRGHSTYVQSNRFEAKQKKKKNIECTNLHTLDDVAHTWNLCHFRCDRVPLFLWPLIATLVGP